MCGITGYVGKGDQEVLKKMNDSIRHRGPDDEGFYINGNVGLGHRRLSIIDLSPGGHQPMTNEDGSVVIVFNGEIYNFHELRKNLSGGHTFKGKSDTEVIVHLYEEIGVDIFSRIQGMFAIALYDKKKNVVILARDRMGKKPLFWTVTEGTLLFGSELKTLTQHPLFKKEIDLVSLNKYFQFEYVPAPSTIFKNTFKLEPGHYLQYDGKQIVKKQYWDIAFPPEAEENNKKDFNKAIAELDSALESAVHDRLESDVPLGVFLSGGIDSSAVAYYAQRNLQKDSANSKIKTFSIGFKEDSFDESKYARQVAEFLGTDHTEVILDGKDCLDIIPHIGEVLDEPMADASIIPTLLLSKITRKHVTVALGGDGGDELFCGYDTFVGHALASLYEGIPLFIRKGFIEPIATHLPVSHKNMSLDFKAKKFISGFYGEKKYRNQRWLGTYDQAQRAKLFLPSIWKKLEHENVFNDLDRFEEKYKSSSYVNRLIASYQKTYMVDDVLVKVDRASMFHSLEVRAPFLDTRVVELANSLPPSFKIHGLTTKYILKKCMEGKLPHDIIYRKKKGFGIPLAKWISTDLLSLMREKLDEKRLVEQGLFNPSYVTELLEDHLQGRADNRKYLWTMLVFQLWWEKWAK